MGYIFISYSHKDKDYVHKLHQHLFEHNLDAWLDDRIDYGSNWPDEIERRLQECSAFILIMSSDSKKSEYVQNELHLARKLNKTIYTLLLEGDNWWHLQTIQYFDVRNREMPSTKFFVSLANVVSQFDKNNPSVSINVAGNVLGSIVVGNDNNVQSSVEIKEKMAHEKAEREARNKKLRESIVQFFGLISSNLRWIGISGVILFVLIFGGLGLNNLVNFLPVATSAAFSQKDTSTPRLPTSTSGSFTSTPQQLLGIGSTSISEKDDMVLVYVPAGEFTMGSDANPNERPIHQVALDAYWIDQTNITNSMYAKCVGDNGACKEPTDASSYTRASYFGNSEFDNYPVTHVLWDDAVRYCLWAGRRLPTESEWEKAARGPNANIYPWGNESPNSSLLNYNRNIGDITKVGEYPNGKSYYGAYDMAGNVWQWVNDWYDVYPGGDASASSSFGQKYRVLRGGSWISYDFVVRSAWRGWYDPASSLNFDLGFRCARTP